MPSGITRTERSSDTHTEASTAPSAMPTAVTPCRIAALRQVEVERDARPFDDDELQRRAGAPEERGDRERDLAQAVLPQVRARSARNLAPSPAGRAGSVLERHAGAAAPRG